MRSFLDLKISDVMSKEIEYVKPFEKLSKVLASEHPHSLLVMEKEKVESLEGMIDYKRLMSSRLDINAEAKSFAVMPPVFEKDEPLTKVVQTLLHSEFRAVPVKYKKDIVGVISVKDLVRAMASSSEFSSIRAKDIMNPVVITIQEDERIGKALHMMKEGNITRLIVEKDGKVAGIITFADILRNFYGPKKKERLGEAVGERKSIMEFPIKGVMKYPVVSVSPDTLLSQIADKIEKFNISDVVVSEKEELIGLISLDDVTRALYFLAKEPMVDFTISGITLEWPDSDFIDRTIRSLLKKDIGNVDPIAFHVKMYEEEGTKKKYSVHARVQTRYGVFSAKGVAWDLTKAFDECVSHLERLITEEKEKLRDKRRKRR